MLNERDLELIGGVVTKAMEPVREEVKELRKDVTKLQVDVAGLQTGMENELRPNICKIAEGHLDLARKKEIAIFD